MKKIYIISTCVLLVGLIILIGCEKVKPTPPDDNNNVTTGNAIFWTATDLACGPITIDCNGESKTITSFNGNGAPICGANGSATFTIDPGTYTYTGKCNSKTWDGTVTITAGTCSKIEITASGGASTSAQAMFWVASDLGCGTIAVTCNGISRNITGYSATGIPACGVSGSATFDLSPGSYSYSAQCSGKTWNGTVTVTAGACSKTQLTGGTNTTNTGQAMFWLGSDLGCGTIAVTCNGISRNITGYSTSGSPACGSSGNATFDLSPGSYSYSAQCSGKTWNGTVTVTAGACSKTQLTGGTNATNTGQAMFWLGSDLGCGTIAVTCNGISRNITGYSTSGSPACGSSGNATFDLSPGSYSYSAQCSGKTWSGTVTVTANGCSKIQLTAPVTTTNTGKATFWVGSDLGCGTITVTCNGSTANITSYYAGTPACGSSGCATFTLNPGTYSYSGKCSSKTWSGTVTISSNGCSTVKFTN